MDHHPVFAGFSPWVGRVEAGLSADFLGVVTRDAYCSFGASHPHARVVAASLPAFDEEYFEWIDLLEAVGAARDRFTMLELGGGWGRWLVRAWAALQVRHPGLPCCLIGVEAVPAHAEWMRQHARDNGVAAGTCEVVEAAVTASDGYTWFHVARPAEWYGQSLTAPPTEPRQLTKFIAEQVRTGQVAKVRAVSLKTLLASEDVVDLIDLDVQGAELDVLSAAAGDLDGKVKRVHVGTHAREIEAGLRELFSRLAWVNVFDHACSGPADTPWGRIVFQDGVQSWTNPHAAAG